VAEASRLTTRIVEDKSMSWLEKLFGKAGSHSAEESGVNLIDAVVAGHTKTVKFLLDNGANVDAVSADGSTALTAAANAGRTRIVELLLKHGAEVSHSALFKACAKGHIGIVRLLLDHGIDVNANLSTQALLLAGIKGHRGITKLMMDRGVSHPARTQKARTNSAPVAPEKMTAPPIAASQRPTRDTSALGAGSAEHYMLTCRRCGFTHHIPKGYSDSDLTYSVDPDAVRMVCVYGRFTVSLEVQEFFAISSVPSSVPFCRHQSART
jgi:hypothetical protein